jgi:hypothetical protein
METIPTREICPQCRRKPDAWRERPAYGSRDLYWIGCRQDGRLAGGNTPAAAKQIWDRMVARWKFEHATPGARTA